jgi:predicted transporter
LRPNILGIRNIIDRNAYQKSWTTQVKAIGAVTLVVVIGAILVITLAQVVDKRYVYVGKRMSPATLIVTVVLLGVLLMGSAALGIWWAYELLRQPVLPF